MEAADMIKEHSLARDFPEETTRQKLLMVKKSHFSFSPQGATGVLHSFPWEALKPFSAVEVKLLTAADRLEMLSRSWTQSGRNWGRLISTSR